MLTVAFYQILPSMKNLPFLAIASLLAANTFLLAERKLIAPAIIVFQDPFWHYAIFAALAALAAYAMRKEGGKAVRTSLLILAPAEAVLLAELFIIGRETALHGAFFLFAELYLFAAAFAALLTVRPLRTAYGTPHGSGIRRWLRSQGTAYIAALAMIVAFSLPLFLKDIGRFAGVDEPLWTFDRIPSYWKNLSEGDFAGTNISDKPGVTLAIISGAGLLSIDDPKAYRPLPDNSQPMDILPLNEAFRTPIALFAGASLILFYILIERALGRRSAIISVALIGSSPILIGMSRIINPDALLWIFAPLSLFSFLAYRRRRQDSFLILSGILLGLALLTKYVANILFPFFLLLPIVWYALDADSRKTIPFPAFFRSAAADWALLSLTALLIFTLLYPTVWFRPAELFSGTIGSEAFSGIFPAFLGMIILLAADAAFLSGKCAQTAIRLATGQDGSRLRIAVGALSLAIFAAVISNVLAGMPLYDFQSVLSSPKSSYRTTDAIGSFLTDFYPLLFGIHPIALAGLIFSAALLLSKRLTAARTRTGTILSLMLFIIAYQAGAAASHVASTARYQIMVYPIAMAIAGVSLASILTAVFRPLRNSAAFLIAPLAIAAAAFSSAYAIHPFHASYASSLLPQRYFLDVKDMGAGSYEAAQYLNALPDAEHLTVWTDKKGLCTFFVGHCRNELSKEELSGTKLDYVVVSWSRESRTSGIAGRAGLEGPFDFASYYGREEGIAYRIDVAGRPGQYVKVIPVAD